MGGDKLLMPNMILVGEDDKLKNIKNVIDETVRIPAASTTDSSEEQSNHEEKDAEANNETSANSNGKETKEETVTTQIQAPPLMDAETEQILGNDSEASLERNGSTESQNENSHHQQQHTTSDDTIKSDGTNGNWENIENLLSTPVPELVEVNSYEENVNGAFTSPQPGQKVHSESVFLRLSNRIKVNSFLLSFFSSLDPNLIQSSCFFRLPFLGLGAKHVPVWSISGRAESPLQEASGRIAISIRAKP